MKKIVNLSSAEFAQISSTGQALTVYRGLTDKQTFSYVNNKIYATHVHKLYHQFNSLSANHKCSIRHF